MGYPAELEKINVTFEVLQRNEGPPDLVFVETEDKSGKGIGIGEWVDLEDGRRALQVEVNQATITRSSTAPSATPAKASAAWPSPDYPGGIIDVGHEEATRLLEEVPADNRVYTMQEFLEMTGSWGYPINEEIDHDDIAGYIEHMAAGGYVIGRPAD